MLGLFVLNNDAGNIVIFPIDSKYFWTFLKKNPENVLFFDIFVLSLQGNY